MNPEVTPSWLASASTFPMPVLTLALALVLPPTRVHAQVADFNHPDPPATAEAPGTRPPALDLDAVLRRAPAGERRWSAPQVAERAVRVSPIVRRAESELGSASAALAEARAGLLPRVQLGGRYTRLSEVDNDPLFYSDADLEAARALAEGVTDPAARTLLQGQLDAQAGLLSARIQVPRNRYGLFATAAYPVSRVFLELLPGIEAAEHGERARAHALEVTRNAVALRVLTTYFEHARARGAEAVAQRSVDQARSVLAQAEARLQAHTGNLPDVLRFRARRAEVEGELLERQADVVASAEALRALLDLPGEGPLGFSESLSAPKLAAFPAARAPLVERALGARPELMAARAAVRSRDAAADAASGAMAPELSLAAGLDYANPNPLFVPPVTELRASYSLSVQLSWSPDGAYRAFRAAEGADADAGAARAREQELQDMVRIEVAGAHARQRSARARLDTARRQLAAAETAHTARLRAFELGLSDSTQVIDAQLDESRAQLAVVDAGARLRLREQELRHALGEPLWARSR